MKALSQFSSKLISNSIWTVEKIFFYPKLVRAYKEIVPNNWNAFPKIIFDVGANKGQSIKFFKNIYPNSKIYAFEPSKQVFKKLEMMHGVDNNVFLFPVGLGKTNQVIDFYESILDETSTFVLPNSNSRFLRIKNALLLQTNKNSFTAAGSKVITIDSFLLKHNVSHINILKIDVEGFEFQVLQGAKNSLIHKKIGVIQFERHLDDMRDDNYPEILEFLNKVGYSKFTEIKHPFGNFLEMLFQAS
jgi:FkbM family methyltransferase